MLCIFKDNKNIKEDIILLCDLRLNTDKEQIEKIGKLFMYNKVDSMICSTV